jgi:transposase
VKDDVIMVTPGIDAPKRPHTVVAVDESSRELGQKTTTATTSDDHPEMLRWASRLGAERSWAVADCRHPSRRLEVDPLGAGQRIVRVPPTLMPHRRDSARTYGKSDPIDALAVARAALRHPDLAAAQLDGPARELRLLVDHREHLGAERTPCIARTERLGPLEGTVSKDSFARHNGIASQPVWSGNRERHRLSRTGNRQINTAIHRIAITQMRCHDAKAYLDRRLTEGNTKIEAVRALKRRFSDVVCRALFADAETASTTCLTQVA